MTTTTTDLPQGIHNALLETQVAQDNQQSAFQAYLDGITTPQASSLNQAHEQAGQQARAAFAALQRAIAADGGPAVWRIANDRHHHTVVRPTRDSARRREGLARNQARKAYAVPTDQVRAMPAWMVDQVTFTQDGEQRPDMKVLGTVPFVGVRGTAWVAVAYGPTRPTCGTIYRSDFDWTCDRPAGHDGDHQDAHSEAPSTLNWGPEASARLAQDRPYSPDMDDARDLMTPPSTEEPTMTPNDPADFRMAQDYLARTGKCQVCGGLYGNNHEADCRFGPGIVALTGQPDEGLTRVASGEGRFYILRYQGVDWQVRQGRRAGLWDTFMYSPAATGTDGYWDAYGEDYTSLKAAVKDAQDTVDWANAGKFPAGHPAYAGVTAARGLVVTTEADQAADPKPALVTTEVDLDAYARVLAVVDAGRTLYQRLSTATPKDGPGSLPEAMQALGEALEALDGTVDAKATPDLYGHITWHQRGTQRGSYYATLEGVTVAYATRQASRKAGTVWEFSVYALDRTVDRDPRQGECILTGSRGALYAVKAAVADALYRPVAR